MHPYCSWTVQPLLIPPLDFTETPTCFILIHTVECVVSLTAISLALRERASALFFTILHCSDPRLLGKMALEAAGPCWRPCEHPAGWEPREERGAWRWGRGQGSGSRRGRRPRCSTEETRPKAFVTGCGSGSRQLDRELQQGFIQTPHLARTCP